MIRLLCTIFYMTIMMTIDCISVALMSKNNQCEFHCCMPVSHAFMNDDMYWQTMACIGEWWFVLALRCCCPKLVLLRWGFCPHWYHMHWVSVGLIVLHHDCWLDVLMPKEYDPHYDEFYVLCVYSLVCWCILWYDRLSKGVR